LPKDLRALAALARESGYAPELLEQVLRSNDQFRKMSEKGREATSVSAPIERPAAV
jgi:UDP-glucose 6-dehydrogenase